MAKTRKRTKTQQKSAISPLMIVVVSIGALLIVIGLIVLGNQSSGQVTGSVDVSEFPTLGQPDAPVTMIEFSDYG